jgi:hypothetical protein
MTIEILGQKRRTRREHFLLQQSKRKKRKKMNMEQGPSLKPGEVNLGVSKDGLR